MVKPRIKTKAAEITEKQTQTNKKNIITFILILIILYIIFSIANNIYNSKTLATNDKVNVDGLEVSFKTNKDKYNIREKVIIYLTIKNTTSSKKEIKFNSQDIAYLTVLKPVNLGLTKFYITVWTNKPNDEPVNKPYSITLKPFEKMTFPMVWDQVDMNGQPVNEGSYKFKVELNTIKKINLQK